jgi:hypothetical protein
LPKTSILAHNKKTPVQCFGWAGVLLYFGFWILDFGFERIWNLEFEI